MAVKKINSLNAHQNPATNENEFDVENYLNVNWEKIIDVVDNNADELIELNDKSNTNIQSLQEEISELKEDVKANSIIVTTEEATSLQVNDANGARAKLSVKGNYRQETRAGYNLLNVPAEYEVAKNFKRVVNSFEAGTYTIKATSVTTDNDAIQRFLLAFEDEAGATFGQSFLYKTTLKTTATLSKKAVAVRIYSADNWDNTAVTTTTFKELMIYSGTDEKSYEEYGKTPSRRFPSEVETVNGQLNIKKFNKNYANTDILQELDVTSIEIISENAFKIDLSKGNLVDIQNRKNILFDAPKNKQYTLSYHVEQNNTAFLPGLGFLYSDGSTQIATKQTDTSYNTQVTSQEGKEIEGIYLSWGTQNSGGIATISNIQLETGTQKTEFEEYTKETYVLDIQQKMLIGDYFDLERKKEVHTWNILELTGNESWTTEGELEKIVRMRIGTGKTSNSYLGKCTHFDFIGNYNLDEEHCYASSAGTLYIFIDKTVASTTEEFKAFLTGQATAGTPVKVYWKSDKTTELDLTETQIEQLEQLNKLRTYKEQTNIVTVEDLALMQLEYSVNIQTYIDNKLANINQQILNIAGGN